MIGDARTNAAYELAREANDRVSLLEHDHYRLSGQSDSRFAANAEFNDWVVNRSEEDWIEISGSYLLPFSELFLFSIDD